MNQNKLTLGVIAVGLGIIVLSQAIFTVDQTEQAIVLQLGQPIGDLRAPGIHFKVPMVQEVRRFDRRILSVDPTPEQMVIASTLTYRAPEEEQVNTETDAASDIAASDSAETDATEEQTAGIAETPAVIAPAPIVVPPMGNVSGEPIIVDSYVRYRISDPLQFMKTLGTVQRANVTVETIVDDATRAVLGSTTLKELLSEERTRVMAAINRQSIQRINDGKLGIEIVDIRIVRADLGEALRDSTVRRMISEMNERATETRAKGEQLATEIRAKADREKTVILANAERDAQIKRGEGDREAIQTYASAFNKDKEFYSFMRSMEAYRTTLADPETRMILSPDSDFFKYFGKR